MNPLVLGSVLLSSERLESVPQYQYVAASPPVSVQFVAPILRSLSSVVLRGRAFFGRTERDVAVKLLRSCAAEARAHRPIELHCCASRLTSEPGLSRLATVRGVYTAVPVYNAESRLDTRRSNPERLVLVDASGKLEPSLLHEYTQVVIMDLYHENLRSFVIQGAPHLPNEISIRTIAADLIGGLMDCAQLGVAHGDPCPKQWLINKHGRLDLTDYGHSWSTYPGCHSQICPVHSYEQAQTGIRRWREMQDAATPPDYPPTAAHPAVTGGTHRTSAYAAASLSAIASPGSLDSASCSFPTVGSPAMGSASHRTSKREIALVDLATTSLPPIASASSHAATYAASSTTSSTRHDRSHPAWHGHTHTTGGGVAAASHDITTSGAYGVPALAADLSNTLTVAVQSGSSSWGGSSSHPYRLSQLNTTTSAEADLTFAAAMPSTGSTTRGRSQISAECACDSDDEDEDEHDEGRDAVGDLRVRPSRHGHAFAVTGAASCGTMMGGRTSMSTSSSSAAAAAAAAASSAATATATATAGHHHHHHHHDHAAAVTTASASSSSRIVQVSAGTRSHQAIAIPHRITPHTMPSLGPGPSCTTAVNAKSGTGTLSGASRSHHSTSRSGTARSRSGIVHSSTSAASGITASTQSSQRSQMTPDGGIYAPATLNLPRPCDEAFYLRGKNQYRAPEVVTTARLSAQYASALQAGRAVGCPACTCGGQRWLCHTADAWGFAAVLFFVATGRDPPTSSEIERRQREGFAPKWRPYLAQEAGASGVTSLGLWAVFGGILEVHNVFERIPRGLRRLLVGGLCLNPIHRWTLCDMVRDEWLAEAAANRLHDGDIPALIERAHMLQLGKEAY